MQVAIISTPREPSYVLETIRQVKCGLAEGDTIEVFSDDPTHFLDYDERHHVAHRHMPLSLWNVAKEMKRSQRACLNFLSALLSGWGDMVIFEDDVAVKPEWRFMLQGVIDESQADAVSLYWSEPKHLGDLRTANGYGWRAYTDPVTFHGSLGLYLRGYVRCALSHHIHRALLRHEMKIQDLLPFDNQVAALCNEQDVVQFMAATVPALVDHRGEVSAIPENRSHGLRRSPGY